MNAISDITLAMSAADYLTLPPLITEDVPVALPEKILKGYQQFERGC